MIGFRVDANERIATGHLMRCLAIASACRSLGEECIFFLAEEKETDRLREWQFPYRVMDTGWDEMEQELPVLKQCLQQEQVQYLVVDSYQATAEYLRQLNQWIPVLYIDDMACERYAVDAVLHYGMCDDKQEYLARYQDTATEVLTGIEYTPLREEFQGVIRSEDTEQKIILITTGGTDPYNVTGGILQKCLHKVLFQEYTFDVIVGSMNQHVEALYQMRQEYPQIRLYQNVSHMSDHMRRAAMAVSAGGTTLLELCACGTPTICFSFADNQQEGTCCMHQKQVMRYAGDARTADVVSAVVEGLEAWIQNPCDREEYMTRMKQLVDGMGAKRIAEFVCSR